jgi:hypothetical protein
MKLSWSGRYTLLSNRASSTSIAISGGIAPVLSADTWPSSIG